MILTKEEIEEMQKLAKPLSQWMADNLHPHTTIILDSVTVQLVEGIASRPTGAEIKS